MALTQNMNKETPDERILALDRIEGEEVTKHTGLVDNSLFMGANRNKLIAYKGKDGLGWFLRYKSGVLPEPLRQCWTSFPLLYRFAEGYFKRRGLRLYEEFE